MSEHPEPAALNVGAVVAARAGWTDAFLREFSARQAPLSASLEEGVRAYVEAGGKRLRPALLLLACEAVGGEPQRAVPAAAAVELFHTWTLVHDDVIDRDGLRRGSPTVHVRAATAGRGRLGLTTEEADRYGHSVAILAGDVLHGRAVRALAALTARGVDPSVTARLITELEGRVLERLIEGELRDVELACCPWASLREEDIFAMMAGKTGELLRFSTWAGALVGVGGDERRGEEVEALAAYALECGTAFQLQDDILGIVGREASLGKPVGSDLREGKRTFLMLDARRHADREAWACLEGVLGQTEAAEDSVREACEVLVALGSVERTRARALAHAERACEHVRRLAPSAARAALEALAAVMVDRCR